MSLKRRRRLWITMLAFFGTALGTLSGYWLGRVTVVGSIDTGLYDYTHELSSRANDYAHEFDGIWKIFNPSRFPFCSQEEIAEMQAITFRLEQVKDIGRVRDDKLQCSSFLGRLDPPIQARRPTMQLPNGIKIYTNVPLRFAASSIGTVFEFEQVNVVLTPTAFNLSGHPHTRSMVLVVNPQTKQYVQIAGTKLDVDPAQVLAQGRLRTAGALYNSHCSPDLGICVVATETLQDGMDGASSLLWEYSVLGGMAGLGLSLAIGQFYLQRLGLAQQLRRALRKDALRLVYQPILRLPSRDCAGAEALVRWSDEEGNPIAPDFFVRIAEDRGFIDEITSFVIRRATEEVGDILRKCPELTLSINISSSDLEGEDLHWLLEQHVLRAGIRPSQIALELTERSTTDLTILRDAILRLHKDGYQIHIDDFGTGFSSLAYLHELAVDAIKIDRTFTRTIGTDAITASILPQILNLAESLQLEVIVEGVETEAQATYLCATGKHIQAQGWCFGKPVSAHELPKYREQMKAS